MKRLLRKKRKLGEYREYGFTVVARFPQGDPLQRDDYAPWDALVAFVESRNLGMGGGLETGMFVSRLCTRRRCLPCNRRYGADRRMGPVTDDDRSAITAWLIEHGAVEAYAGPLVDANHASLAEYEATVPKLSAEAST